MKVIRYKYRLAEKLIQLEQIISFIHDPEFTIASHFTHNIPTQETGTHIHKNQLLTERTLVNLTF
ncbi:hypothetical protein BVRB_7g171000 [Beta vulgaris subsp. vulgaris]|nr:hypothetical protein BVRB_7g171000 [Beta vulgaris subsp. vulgaris]